MKNINISSRQLIDFLAGPQTVFYLLPLLMGVLVAGTVAQKDLGLYEAHRRFFESPLIWAGPLPIPGGYMLIGLLALCLTLKLLFKSEWRLPRAGIILAHLGVLVLLIGALISLFHMREGFMVIAEGERTPYIYDYRERALLLTAPNTPDQPIPFSDILRNQPLPGISLPFRLEIESLCANCTIVRRLPEEAEGTIGMARFMKLQAGRPAKDPEENLAGLTFSVSGLDKDQNGLYIAFEGMPKPVNLTHGGTTYSLILGRAQRSLLFSLRLDNFTKESYPGTDKARSYRSDITVMDGALEWPARISMNKPLYYKGYKFYQSSFEQGPTGEQISILSVVENEGRLFPYIAGALVAAGLILHLALMALARHIPGGKPPNGESP
ncbi:MAG: cytochrome c biogenesis protein ResB [Alphaproteobacteria bacterium]|nr:cytochrome c biogenesis protein ResB [Alphaproteobacteria bacterium]